MFTKLTRGLVLAGACLAGLATAAPAAGQSLDLGAVTVTRTAVQAPIAAHAPVRVLSPGRNEGGATSRARTNNGSGVAVQAPIAANAPVRVLSPGHNGDGTSSRAGAGNGSGAAVQGPIAVNAPIRVLSPGDDGAGVTDPGNGGETPDGTQTEPGPGPSVDMPVTIDLPVRILSPGDDGGTGGGVLPAEDGESGSEGSGSANGGAAGGGALAASAAETACPQQAMSLAGGGTSPFAARSLVLLALLALGLAVLQGSRVPLGRWLR
jgi:hypothetical protein